LLSPDFSRHYFPDSNFRAVVRDTHPDTQQYSILVCERADASLEFSVMSRQVQDSYYDFIWLPGEQHKSIFRMCNGRPGGPASATLLPGTRKFSIVCADIEERIDFDSSSLVRLDGESSRDRNLKLMPWKRLLVWFGRLKMLDPSGYNKVPGPLKQFLQRPDFEMVIANLTEQHIQGFIQQGLIPAELDSLQPEHMPGVVATIRVQQGIAAQAAPTSTGFFGKLSASLGMQTGPAIPAILTRLDPNQLELVDMQALITMGALIEVEGFAEREWRKLLARRPDLQARLKSPEGQNSVMQDMEVQMLQRHPEVQKAMQEQAWRASGLGGPTPTEQNESMQRVMAMQMMFGVPFDPGANLFKKRLAWKIYDPFRP
jgi:hypothetical protein